MYVCHIVEYGLGGWGWCGCLCLPGINVRNVIQGFCFDLREVRKSCTSTRVVFGKCSVLRSQPAVIFAGLGSVINPSSRTSLFWISRATVSLSTSTLGRGSTPFASADLANCCFSTFLLLELGMPRSCKYFCSSYAFMVSSGVAAIASDSMTVVGACALGTRVEPVAMLDVSYPTMQLSTDIRDVIHGIVHYLHMSVYLMIGEIATHSTSIQINYNIISVLSR
jgi:hypothetical protein